MSIHFLSAGESWENAFTGAMNFLRRSEGLLLLGPALGESAKEWIKDKNLEEREILLGLKVMEWKEWIQGRARANALNEGEPFRILNQASLREFFRSVLQAVSENEAFYHLKELWPEERFFSALLESVEEARLAGLAEPAAIERAREMLAGGADSVTREAYNDLWFLLTAFERGLAVQSGVHDFASLVRKAEAGPSPDLYLLGFDHLSLLETDLLRGIAREKEVHLPLALPEGAIRSVLEGKEAGDHTAVQLVRALVNGFAGKVEVSGARGPQSRTRFLLSAHAPSEEYRAAAAFAREALAQNKEVRFLLPTGALEEYGALFREELGLPKNFFSRSVLAHPVARFFLHALELKERNYELSYGLELAQLLSFTLGKFRAVPALAARAGVRTGLRDWERGNNPDLLEFASFLRELDRLLPSRGPASAYAEAITKVAALCGIGELARRAPDLEVEREAHAALAALLRHAQMLAASAKEVMDFSSWMGEWKELVKQARAGEALSFFPRLQFYRYGEWLPPAGKNTLTLALGWNQSVIPRRSFSFYFEEGARRKLSELSFPTQVEEELSFLDQMSRVQASAGAVIFSHPRHDESGKEVEPSWMASALPFFPGEWPEVVRGLKLAEKEREADPVVPNLPSFSASLLEMYRECPFRAFALKVLKLEDKAQAASLDLGHLDMGSIVHRTLELFYGEKKGKGAPNRNEILGDCLAQAVGEQKVEYFKGTEALLTVQVEKLRKTLSEFLRMDAENYERFPFFRDPDVEVEVSGSLGDLPWKGKIDRIDVDEENKRFLVIDYKSGASTPSSSELSRLERFQLQLYLDAAEKRYPGFEPVGGLYVSLKTGERKQGLVRKEFNENKKEPGKLSYFGMHSRSGALKSDEEFESLRKESREEAERLARRIQEGAFPPGPLTEEKCGRCEVRPACRIREIQGPPKGEWRRSAPDFSWLWGEAPERVEKGGSGKGFNEEQQRALEQEGLVFIEASAGTGKTTVIVEKIRRFLRGRMEKGDPSHRAVERFAAISFTEKSASELGSRLAQSLMAEEGMGPKVAAQAIRQISTIHGFCRRVLSDFPVEAGMSPMATLMDEREAEALRAGALEEFFLFPPEECKAALDTLYGYFQRAKIEGFLRKLQGRRLLLGRDIALYRAWIRGEAERPGELIPAGMEKEALGALLHLSESFSELYSRLKKKQERLDFNDLEEMSLKALGHEHVQRSYRERFELILVDEFQDTNSVQRELLEKIALPGWKNLFVVGDAKQSIYRFRAADVSVFQFLRAEAESAGSLVTLFRNYRSRRELVGAANLVTESIFPAAGAGAEFEAVAARAEAFREEGGRIEVKGYEEEEKLSAGERRKLEADLLVELVKEQLAKGREPGSIAVLMRKMSGNEAYLRALTNAGIPFRVGSSKGFYAQSVVMDGISLLRALFGASNDMALLAVLRSPWAGFSDSQILKLQRRRWPVSALWNCLEEKEAPLLFAWRNEADFRGLSEILEEAYRHYPLDRQSHLQTVKLLAILRGMEREAMPRMEILDRLTLWCGWESEESAHDDSTMPEPGSGGAVQVMTVHSAKGLEFDVTILPDLNASLQPDRSALRIAPGIGIGLKLEDEEKPEAYAAVGEKNTERDLAESKRLLYVALTRAKEECVLLLPRNPKKNSWAAWIRESGLESAGAAAPVKRVDVPEKKEEGKESPLSVLPFRFQTSISELAAYQFCAEFHRRKFVQGWDDQVVALWPEVRRRPGAKKKSPAGKEEAKKLLKELGIQNKERGIALHRVLERVGEQGLSLGELWLTEAYSGQGVDVDHPALEQLIQLDLQLLSGFLSSPLGRDLFAPEVKAFPEIPFQWRLGHALVHGAMDRLIRRPDGAWVVVDYKSSVLEDSLERYRFQVASYMVAVAAHARSLGEKDPRVLGYLVDLYESKSIPVETGIREANELLAEEIARARKNYTLADTELGFRSRGVSGGEHCFSCPYSMHCEIGLAFK